MSKKLTWRTEKRKVNDLIPFDKNPRTLSPKQEEALKASLSKFNLVEIPAINTDNKIIAGHQRVKILQLLGRGEEEIEVRIPNRKLTEKEYKEYLLRSNANTGDWEFELLQNFDLDLLLDIGFDDRELSSIWDNNLETEDDNFNIEKEIEEIKTSTVQEGNIYQLGKHRLVCGSSTDPNVVKKLMRDKKVSMAYCDPPFNIGLDYNKGMGKKNKYGGQVDDNKTEQEYHDFIKSTVKNALAFSLPDCHFFYYCDQNYVGLFQEIYKELGIAPKRVCLWIKGNQNPTPQVAFNKMYEPCVYGATGNPYLAPSIKNFNEVLNREIGTGNGALDDIEDLIDIWLAKRLAGNEYEHPTSKPITLHEKPIRRCTKIGDCVLDLFGGSGSTLLACEQMKRQCFMVEKDKIFCQLIINRFESYANIKTKKIN